MIYGRERENEIVIFRTDDETINVEVRFEDETAWLTQDQMSVLFSKSKSTINEHIKNVFKEGELDEKEVVRKFRITTPHGAIEGKTQSHEVNFYNLDVIISVGYRENFYKATAPFPTSKQSTRLQANIASINRRPFPR